MNYKIISKTQKEDTIITLVEFNNSGDVFQATISHFQPQDLNAISENIKNRGLVEVRNREAATFCDGLMGEIVLNQIIEI